MALNRFSYVYFNPMIYTDPSGHIANLAMIEGQYGLGYFKMKWEIAHAGLGRFGVVLTGSWSDVDKKAVSVAVKSVGMKLADMKNEEGNTIVGGTPWGAFRKVFGVSHNNPLVIDYGNCKECNGEGAYTPSTKLIQVANLSDPIGARTPDMAFINARNNIVHELGHVFGQKFYYWNEETQKYEYSSDGPYFSIPNWFLNNDGFAKSPEAASTTWQQHPCVVGDCSPNEIFADMFLGWTFDKRASGPEGNDRNNFMLRNMMIWVGDLVNEDQ
jgi:hypothetical protein